MISGVDNGLYNFSDFEALALGAESLVRVAGELSIVIFVDKTCKMYEVFDS